ncbi:hypothetical protein ACFPVT_04700 [Corynebacterium choanae]|uniref:hypothetical protein n=1 Tax=Corynebacterium choanae TaxID=1862358 RepID=UPI000F4E7D7A|nr:hypothetical protein [Corynebacterium choanae]
MLPNIPTLPKTPPLRYVLTKDPFAAPAAVATSLAQVMRSPELQQVTTNANAPEEIVQPAVVCLPPLLTHQAVAAQLPQYAATLAVVGYPAGCQDELVKAAEARLCLAGGATGIVAVAQHSVIVGEEWNRQLSELVTLREAVPEPLPLAILFAPARLTADQLNHALHQALQAGVQGIWLFGELATSDGRSAFTAAAQVRGSGVALIVDEQEAKTLSSDMLAMAGVTGLYRSI